MTSCLVVFLMGKKKREEMVFVFKSFFFVDYLPNLVKIVSVRSQFFFFSCRERKKRHSWKKRDNSNTINTEDKNPLWLSLKFTQKSDKKMEEETNAQENGNQEQNATAPESKKRTVDTISGTSVANLIHAASRYGLYAGKSETVFDLYLNSLEQNVIRHRLENPRVPAWRKLNLSYPKGYVIETLMFEHEGYIYQLGVGLTEKYMFLRFPISKEDGKCDEEIDRKTLRGLEAQFRKIGNMPQSAEQIGMLITDKDDCAEIPPQESGYARVAEILPLNPEKMPPNKSVFRKMPFHFIENGKLYLIYPQNPLEDGILEVASVNLSTFEVSIVTTENSVAIQKNENIDMGNHRGYHFVIRKNGEVIKLSMLSESHCRFDVVKEGGADMELPTAFTNLQCWDGKFVIVPQTAFRKDLGTRVFLFEPVKLEFTVSNCTGVAPNILMKHLHTMRINGNEIVFLQNETMQIWKLNLKKMEWSMLDALGKRPWFTNTNSNYVITNGVLYSTSDIVKSRLVSGDVLRNIMQAQTQPVTNAPDQNANGQYKRVVQPLENSIFAIFIGDGDVDEVSRGTEMLNRLKIDFEISREEEFCDVIVRVLDDGGVLKTNRLALSKIKIFKAELNSKPTKGIAEIEVSGFSTNAFNAIIDYLHGKLDLDRLKFFRDDLKRFSSLYNDRILADVLSDDFEIKHTEDTKKKVKFEDSQ